MRPLPFAPGRAARTTGGRKGWSMTPQDALALIKSGRLDEAHAACARLLSASPEDRRVVALAARVALQLRRPEEAYGLLVRLRRLYGQGGARPRDFLDLAVGFQAAGALEKAEEAVSQALTLRADVPVLFLKHAEILLALGREKEAGEAAVQALAVAPDQADILADIAVMLQQSGRLAEACETYARVAAGQPSWDFLYNNWAAALLALGRAGEAAEVAGRWLAQVPGSIEALSFQAVALAEAGDEAADALLDFDRFVKTVRIGVPAGYQSLEEFNAALEAHVLAHPTLKTPDENHPTYHDPNLMITTEILDDDKGPVAELEEEMRKAVSAYFDELGDDPAHPFVRHKPQDYRLSAWAAVLDRQGNQHQHIHEDGYLSGCYYIRIPPEVRDQQPSGDGEIAGGFEVGRPPDEFGCRRAPKVRAIKPEPGLMVLFPAYMYHRTIPFRSDQQRICIAFDVLPES